MATGKELIFLNQQDAFAGAQIITIHPVLQKSRDIQTQYFLYLKKLIKLTRWNKRKYVRAQLKCYRNYLCGQQPYAKRRSDISLISDLAYLIPFDFAAIAGAKLNPAKTKRVNRIAHQIAADFHLPASEISFLEREFQAAMGNKKAWEATLKNENLQGFLAYLERVRDNVLFVHERPYSVLFTATMSAGKSTLINALAGKNISLAQNMACTSKIHAVISKCFEDGMTCEYDHDLLMEATEEELLNNNDANKSTRITVGTCFQGLLSGQRVVFLDSPGVNSSQNAEHAEITYEMIRSKKYKLIVYVLNATQLGTTDDEQHLEAVAKQIGRTKVIFVMNQIDHLISDDDDIFAVIEKQRDFLISKGFCAPIICPASARAAYLAKKSQREAISRYERRELDNFMNKFEQQSLSDYYEKTLQCGHIPDSDDEVRQLLKNCGVSYLEQIIKQLKNQKKIQDISIVKP